MMDVPSPRLHFAPADHRVGDVHPIVVEGKCYLFYLKADVQPPFQSALAVSDDLLRWRSVALQHLRPQAKHAEYFVVAPFYDHQGGLYRSFFGLESSCSADLVRWDRAEAYRLPRVPGVYLSQRDPCVTWDSRQEVWYCVMTCRQVGAPEDAQGAIGLFKSKDLQNWTHCGPAVTGVPGEPECPQLFPFADRWVLLAAIQRGMVGGFTYWLADGPEGTWSGSYVLDGEHFCAPQVAWDGRRWLAFAWAPSNAARPGHQRWGGHLCLPREIVARADGRLASRLPSDVSAAIRGDLLADFFTTAEEDKPGDAIAIPPNRRRGDLQVEIPAAAAQREVAVRFARADGTRFEVVYDPAGRRLCTREGRAARSLTSTPCALGGKEGSVSPGLSLRVLWDTDLVETFLDDEYSLATRIEGPLAGSELAVCAGREARVRLFEVRLP